jgi:hypothetical protein
MQLTVEEQRQINKWVGHEKKSGAAVVKLLNKQRLARKQPHIEKSAVYRFIAGETHSKDSPESRGRDETLTRADTRKLQQARRRLLREADSEHRVTWQDVLDEAALDSAPCLRVVQDALRSTGVRFRPPRRKIGLSQKDAKKRFEVGLVWKKKTKRFWTGTHGYYDNKSFPMPLTAGQRSKLRQTRITGHLRLPGEGVEQGFTKPREAHSWIGFPSVTISAVVAKNRIIMWEEIPGTWNGQKAADVYQGPMIKALRRVWGRKRSYRIVEDGDRKGNQSNKGIAAKHAAGIQAMTLPPRTPCWMPLDYAIWSKIMDRVLETAPPHTETKKQFLVRLRHCALTLPRSWVAAQIGRMTEQIKGVVDAKGYHPKRD